MEQAADSRLRAASSARAKNKVALGALQEATRLFPPGSCLAAIPGVFKREGVPLVLNQGAFARGAHACREAEDGRQGGQT